LHFTNRLRQALLQRGVEFAYLTLHVGIGTFRPVKVEDLNQHQMHAESYQISAESATQINRARSQGRRVVAVGTTTVRTLESVADPNGRVESARGEATLFIVPGYRYRCVDALITNFHVPRSTLLMMVSALAGRERILASYEEAKLRGYRFFSFGDAMLIT
jgi:S-adenosylmethionine:tRNA ribosyltransferase-isomerase